MLATGDPYPAFNASTDHCRQMIVKSKHCQDSPLKEGEGGGRDTRRTAIHMLRKLCNQSFLVRRSEGGARAQGITAAAPQAGSMPRAQSTGSRQLEALLAAKVASDAAAPPPVVLPAPKMAAARPGALCFVRITLCPSTGRPTRGWIDERQCEIRSSCHG